MARLSGRVIDRPADSSTPAPEPAAPTLSTAKAPTRQSVNTSKRQGVKAPEPVTAELDSLLSRLVEEAPMPAPRRRPAQARPAAVDAPAPAAPARRIPWRGLLLGVASTAVIAALAFAPRLRGLVAAPAKRPDGTAVPVTGVDKWLAENGDGKGYLI